MEVPDRRSRLRVASRLTDRSEQSGSPPRTGLYRPSIGAYAGSVPTEYSSGAPRVPGSITKPGTRELAGRCWSQATLNQQAISELDRSQPVDGEVGELDLRHSYERQHHSPNDDVPPLQTRAYQSDTNRR